MTRPIDPSKRYVADKPCPLDGTHERYIATNHCCECRARANGVHKRNVVQPSVKKPKLVARAVPPAHPHVIESDWIKPPTKAQLMAGR